MSYACRGCGGTCCTGVGNDPCTCPPPPDHDDDPLYPRRSPGAHGRHCTWPECDGSCLVAVTVEWRALDSFLRAALEGRANRPSTAGESTGLNELKRIIELGRNGSRK